MKYIFFGLIFLYINGCTFKEKPHSWSGLVTMDRVEYLYNSYPNFITSDKIWYKDSIAIEEVHGLKILTDIYSHTTVNQVLEHYAYINFSTKSVYYYKSFADTAAIFKKNVPFDSLANEGAWNFLKPDSAGNDSGDFDLPDTVINGNVYKRMQFNARERNFNKVCVEYFDCNKPDFIFNIDETYRRKTGCPVVKIFIFREKGLITSSAEVNILSDSLKQNELKVFAAWQKNERNNSH